MIVCVSVYLSIAWKKIHYTKLLNDNYTAIVICGSFDNANCFVKQISKVKVYYYFSYRKMFMVSLSKSFKQHWRKGVGLKVKHTFKCLKLSLIEKLKLCEI